MFTAERGLPDLSSLVISKGSGECGDAYVRSFDPVAARERVFSFDWSPVTTDFDGFIKHAETSLKPRKQVKEQDALKLMSTYYFENKSNLPTTIRQSREQIIELIMECFSPAEAFAKVLSQ